MKDTYTVWELGPYHYFLPAPMKLNLVLDGEWIHACEIETGFLHKGLEKAIELHSWKSAIVYSDHLDPEVAVFGEWVFCLATEDIAQIQVPPRAQAIRVIVSELTRIASHLMFMVRMARVVSSDTVVHYLLRDREKILDLFELLTGARFALNFLRLGGVCADVTDGFIERVLEVCEMIRIRIKEYNDIFTFNHSFLKRTVKIGELSPQLIYEYGMTGPNARASGIDFDVRREMPYGLYKNIDFKIPLVHSKLKKYGDVHDRCVIRLREINQSMEILKQLAEILPLGEYLNPQSDSLKTIPKGEAYGRIESARGLLGCHVVSHGSEKPFRVQFRAPTSFTLMSLPKLLQGLRVEDLPVILASMDLGISESDR